MFAEEDRKYNASGSHQRVLREHFTIRLVDHIGRTGDHAGPVVWGYDWFVELHVCRLVLFPVYVLRNHGSVSDEQLDHWLTVLIFAPRARVVHGVMRFSAYRSGVSFRCAGPAGNAFPRSFGGRRIHVPLYELAVLAFVATE